MASESLDSALATMPPPSRPHHRTSSSTNQTPDSPIRADTFKRMSTASIVTPISESSTRPNSMTTAYTEVPSELSSPGSRKSVSLDANPFLTAVAAQERRVLELREELQKAEAELQTLKKSWAQQEAVKKKQEIRQHAEAMRPLTSPTRAVGTALPPAESLRHSLDEERKRAAYARPRVPERRVFEGRHTRTLSLLSPGALANRATSGSKTGESSVSAPKTATLPSREAGAPLPTPPIVGRPHANSKGAKEDIVNTGKQIVGDIREGLWSFWDDLRQATVGEEALQEPPPRRPSQQAKSPAGSGTPAGPSRTNSSTTLQQPPSRRASRSPHARSNTVAGTVAPIPRTPGRTSQKILNLGATAEGDIVKVEGEDDGGWSNWDSPAAKTVVSTAGTGSSPASTPRTSVSSTASTANNQGGSATTAMAPSHKTDTSSEQDPAVTVSETANNGSIPWPANLKKFRPSSLHRTASHLMKEWERSLTPPAEEAEKDWIDRYIDGPRSSRAKEAVPPSK